MAHTYRIHTGNIERIHTAFPVDETPAILTVQLASHEKSLAQIDLIPVVRRRALGRRLLEVTVLDRSGIPELHDQEASYRLKIPLGHTAVVGRGSIPLPLFDSEIVSEQHLVLGYVRDTTGDSMTVNDYGSANGSHIVEADEESWQEAIEHLPVGYEPIAEAVDQDDPVNWEWLHDRNTSPPPNYRSSHIASS